MKTPTSPAPASTNAAPAARADGLPPALVTGQQLEWLWTHRDALTAGFLALVSLVTVQSNLVYGVNALVLLLTPAAPVLLLWRRRFPVAVAVALATLHTATVMIYGGNVGLVVALGVAMYTLGAHLRPKVSLPLGGFLLLAGPLVFWWGLHGDLGGGLVIQFGDPYAGSALGDLGRVLARVMLATRPLPLAEVPLALALVGGMLIRNSRENQQRAAHLEAMTADVESQTHRRVLLEERAGIARDLHDSVAHHVTLMVIQAESGPDLVRRGEADVLRGFAVIGDAGRRALAELDRTLAALRDDAGAELAPQPRLEDLPALVDGIGTQGIAVELSWLGERRALSSAVEVAAYRIVQESLTNVVRHAGTDRASVLVEYQPQGLSVQVTDHGAGFDPAAGTAGQGGGGRRSSGHGLAGMRERARVQGGTLAIASMPGAGTAVSAYLPEPE